jgi:hypothetical protein
MSSVSGALVAASDGATRRVKCDAIASDSPRTPAFELCSQAGVEPARDLARRCFSAACDDSGRTLRRDVFVVGSLARVRHDDALYARVADAVIERVRHGGAT